MARPSKRKNTRDGADRQPASLTDLKVLVDEFIGKARSIENEMELLKEDLRLLMEEYEDRLDMKTLKQALRVAKIKEKVEHKDTFDTFTAILDGEVGTDAVLFPTTGTYTPDPNVKVQMSYTFSEGGDEEESSDG